MKRDRDLSPLEQSIVDVVRPAGSMTIESMVEALQEDVDESDRIIKIRILDLVRDGVLREHPHFEGAYVVDD